MRALKASVVVLSTLSVALAGVPSIAHAAAPVTRPVAELFGAHASFGLAGDGVNTATGNFTRTSEDLRFGGLRWARTYNSLGGWTTSYSAHLVPGDGSVAFHDDDGRVLTFVADGQGFRRPADLEADLSRVDGGFALRYNDGDVWSFDGAGRLTRLAADGEQVSLSHGERLDTVTHDAGERLSLSYNASGQVERVTSGDGRAVSYGYTDGRLTSVTAPDGASARYEYEGGRLTAVFDAEGRKTVGLTYDDRNRVRHQDFTAGGGVDLAYDDNGVTTVTATSTGARALYEHDPAGRLVKATDPAGNVVTRTFDDRGRTTGATSRGGAKVALEYDGRGNVTKRTVGERSTTYTYDDRDRLTSATDAGQGVTRYGYAGESRVPSEVTDPNGAVTRNTVTNGLVTETVDAAGVKTTFGYEGRRLTSSTDGVGQTTRFGYDAAGRRTTTTSPTGRVSAVEYDAAGRVTARTSPSGAVERDRYTSSGLLVETTDPTGAVTAHDHDGAGRRVASTDPLGRRTTYAHDSDGNVTTSTNPAGGVSRYTYDPFGRVSTVTAPAGEVVRYTYDADGRQAERVEPAGTEVTAYDQLGNVVSTTDAAGRTTRYTYDSQDREITRTDPIGAVWRTAYDAAGRVSSRTDPLGAVTRYEYDAAGRLTALIDPLGSRTQYKYDAAGRLVETVDPEGGVERNEYDADGRRVAQTSPAGLVTRYTFDADGRITTSTDPRGGVSKFEYNARGEVVATTTPTGAVRRMEYDAAGQLVAAVDPLGARTSYGYDAAGNLTSLTDAKGAVTAFTYDAGGRQTSSTDPLGRTTRREYDAAGNLVNVVDPEGRALRQEFDAVGELVKRSASDGSTTTYTYDANARRASMTDATGTYRYEYDLVGRLTGVVEPDGAKFGATYDAAGRRTELAYPDGLKVAYRWNRNGRLVGLTDPKAGEVSYKLDQDGRLVHEDLPGKWARSYAYEGGLLARYEEDGATKQRTAFTRDADGRIVTETDGRPHAEGGGRTTEYRYDAAGRLVAVNGKHDAASFDYDVVGNRTRIARGHEETRLTYDAADQLLAADTGRRHTDYRYDSVGRLVERKSDRKSPHDESTGRGETLAVSYNGFGLPVATTRTRGHDVGRTQASFNGDGLLVALTTGDERSGGSDTTRYRWSVGDVVPQIVVQQRGKEQVDFVYGHGRVFADEGRKSATFSRDAHSSALRTGQTHEWVQADEYDEFGAPERPDAEADTHRDRPKFGYRGELARDDAVYLRARVYDAGVGRFTTRDPVATKAGQVNPTSAYAYADNDPVNFTDPLGEWSLADAILRAVAAVFAAAAVSPCPPAGNSIERHDKCFQNHVYRTRGYIPEDCLDADHSCLDALWHGRQPERASQAFTIHELNVRRQSVWDDFWDNRGWSTTISERVDWEVGPPANYMNTFRIDIVTEEKWIYEVKRWSGGAEAEVNAQLGYYQYEADWYDNVRFDRGVELKDWADTFQVSEGFWDFLSGGKTVYVWGYGNPSGHVYFEEKDRTPERVRNKVRMNRLGESFPIPIPIPVPVPVPVPV
ncbi:MULTISPECIES: RHS repeat-associated core domain-containing protein [unclassified Saccharothrix]|uniref:RHS repeat-associated core domain-containing protein n=1 Tax=unclassified Saccharothrix TaxID=2593673 RepID=UPI00307FC59E